MLRRGDDASRFVRWGDEAADGARLLENGDGLARHGDDAEQIRVVDEVVDGLCSFSPDTPVATADGPRPIVELQVGDLVLAYHEGLRTTGVYTVTAVWAHVDPVILQVTLGGETIEATPEHPFYVLLRGWVPAAELRVGDAVRRADGSYGRVADVAVVQRAQTMYNLTVAGAHTFFVGDQGWLVHNDCDDELYYRAVSDKEWKRIEQSGMITPKRTILGIPKGEQFISPAIEYVLSLITKRRGRAGDYVHILQWLSRISRSSP